MYRVQHYERRRIPKVPVHLNRNMSDVSKSVEYITELFLVTINMS